MTGKRAVTSTRASRVINATPDEIYAAFMDPAALIAWLPPGEMTGKMHAFDARVSGGYRMSLLYPANDLAPRGKTSAREDVVNVRFVELVPGCRIVEAVTFETTDPTLLGEMTIIVTLERVPGGTVVTLVCKDLPPGLRPDDNEPGSRRSLEQLAHRFA